MRNSKIFSISLPEKLAKEVEMKSKQKGLARSEIFRSALIRYLNEEKNERLFRAMIQRKAREMNIRTDDDIEDLIDSMRR